MNLAWTWGYKISDQLLLDALRAARGLFSGIVLDVGCGAKPYRAELGSDARQWFGVDFKSTASGPSAADVFADGLEMPFAEGVVDTVLSTQTLEHVQNPAKFIREAQRVLRIGGYLVLSAPQTNPLHEEPADYFRFTCYGLRLLAEEAGLQVIETRPLGGAIATIGQMVIWHLSWVRRIPLIGLAILPALKATIGWMALTLDPITRLYGGGAMKDTINWLLIAKKIERA